MSNVAAMAPSIKKQIGILGGGQLSAMMLDSCKVLGIAAWARCSNKDEPVVRQNLPYFIGDPIEFLSSCQVITFENEFISQKDLGLGNNSRVISHPEFNTLEKLSDKLFQKELLCRLNIPTSPYVAYSGTNNITDWVNKSAATTLKSNDLVLKWAQFGYDGYGTLILENLSDNINRIDAFLKKATEKKTAIFAEKKISFTKEVAIVAARDQHGNIVYYPLIETVQKNGVCDFTKFLQTNIFSELNEKAKNIITTVLKELDYVGLLAIEFFLTDDGELFVNELAPRVHNSAHYTLNAFDISQFDQHILCVSNQTARVPTLQFSHYGMLNLLGPNGFEGPATAPNVSKFSQSSCFLHWYNKTQSRPGRKLGHINIVTDNAAEFTKLWAQALELRSKWQESLKGQ